MLTVKDITRDSIAHLTLTARKRQVADLLCEGKTLEEVATVLNVSLGGVKVQMVGILDKLRKASSRGAADDKPRDVADW